MSKEIERLLKDINWPKENPLNPYSINNIESLAEEIKIDGIKNPIVCISNGTIISGHRRLAAAKLTGLTKIPVIIVEGYPDQESMKWDMFQHNYYRRKTTADLFQDIKWLEEMLPKRQGTGAIREKIAKMIDLSGKTIDKIKEIAEKWPELFYDIETGKMSIDGAYNAIKFIDGEELELMKGDDRLEYIISGVDHILETNYLREVSDNGVPLKNVFYKCVRKLPKVNAILVSRKSSLHKPKPETEASNQPLVNTNEGDALPGEVETDEEVEIIAPQESQESEENSEEEDSVHDSEEPIVVVTDPEEKVEAVSKELSDSSLYTCANPDCCCYGKQVKVLDSKEIANLKGRAL